MAEGLLIGRKPLFNRELRVFGYLLLPWTEGRDRGWSSVLDAVLAQGVGHLTGPLEGYLQLPASVAAEHAEALAGLADIGVGVWLEHADAAFLRTVAGAAPDLGLIVRPSTPEALEGHAPRWWAVDASEARDAGWREALRGRKWLADGVDDYETAMQMQEWGAQGFAGAFFQKPERVRARAPQANAHVLKVLADAWRAESPEELAASVRSDPDLSYRLLRYINAPAFGLRARVSTIEQALALLGLVRTRRWLSLVALSALAQRKPDELVRTALVRARFGELFARRAGDAETGDDFLVGLFSVLDAMLDQPMEEAIADLPVADEVRAGLLDPKSRLGKRLAAAKALERGRWDEVLKHLDEGRVLSLMETAHLYHEAIAWADAQMQALVNA